MAGVLVGEIVDALEQGTLQPLLTPDKTLIGAQMQAHELLVLLAIAEKCHADTRQGQVRTSRINAVTGGSRRRTERILKRLRDAGLLRVVKRGHKPKGKSVPLATLYELSELPKLPPSMGGGSLTAKLPPPNSQASATPPPLTCGASSHDGRDMTEEMNTPLRGVLPAPASAPAPNPEPTRQQTPPTKDDTDMQHQQPRPTVLEALADAARNGSADRGTRITADYMPRPDTITKMRTECPNVDLRREHAKFIDYWLSKPGRDARKLDWDAVWRNWIRRAAELSGSRNGDRGRNGSYTSKQDEKVAEWEVKAAQILSDPTQLELE